MNASYRIENLTTGAALTGWRPLAERFEAIRSELLAPVRRRGPWDFVRDDDRALRGPLITVHFREDAQP